MPKRGCQSTGLTSTPSSSAETAARFRRLRRNCARSAFSSASDSAPRLFESAVRLRNLMALAKYGAMDVKDIRRVTGVGHLKRDPLEHAPFGHGEIVRIWQTADGTAAALDPSRPAAAPSDASYVSSKPSTRCRRWRDCTRCHYSRPRSHGIHAHASICLETPSQRRYYSPSAFWVGLLKRFALRWLPSATDRT